MFSMRSIYRLTDAEPWEMNLLIKWYISALPFQHFLC